MMEPKEFNTMNIYDVLVKETHDHHSSEWFGSLILIHQENGKVFLDISFTDQEIISDFQDQARDRNDAILSIECIENGDLQEVESLTRQKFSMDINLPIDSEIYQIDHEESYYEQK